MAALTLVATFPSVAQAQDKRARAKALVIEGQNLYNSGDYTEALSRFERAFATYASPKIQYNFGQVYDKLDRPADAMRAFQTFLAEAGDAAPANVAKARETVARLNKKVGTLELDGDLTGAEVSVDGKSYGSSNKIILDPGPHQLTVDKVGQQSFLARLTAVGGDHNRLTVRFNDPTPAPQASLPPAGGGSRLPSGGSGLPSSTSSGTIALGPPVGAVPGLGGGLVPTQSEEKDVPAGPTATPWQITAGWVSSGVAVVLLGAGVGGRLMANKKYADFNAYRDPKAKIDMCNRAVHPDYGGAPCRELLSSGDTYSLLSTIGVVSGSVAAAAAVVFFLTAPSSSHPPAETASVSCSPTLGYTGASCRMTF